jgi:hypothetical protein
MTDQRESDGQSLRISSQKRDGSKETEYPVDHGRLVVWREPFAHMGLPKLFDLRSDPFEAAETRNPRPSTSIAWSRA